MTFKIPPERMIMAALVVCDQATHEARDGPIKPNAGLRFAMSYLYANSAGDRSVFSKFLMALQDAHETVSLEGERNYIRCTQINGCLRGIIRAVGYPETPEASHALTKAWQKP